MIYTIGHKSSYQEAIEKYGSITKLEGGYAFKSVEDAQKRIQEHGKEELWVVWGLAASWESDTQQDGDNWWHILNKEVPIIDLISKGE